MDNIFVERLWRSLQYKEVYLHAYGALLAALASRHRCGPGIINAAGRFAKSSQAELSTIYGNLGNAVDFTDIAQGSCGPNQGHLARSGWDFCTGAGTAFGTKGGMI